MQYRSLNIEPTNVMRLAVEVRIVAVEPVNTTVRLQIGRIQDAPDRGTSHRFVGITIDQDRSQFIDAPVARNAVMFGGLAGRERDDFELFIGGKSSGADRSVGHLEDPRGVVADSAFAKERRYCDCNSSRWRLVDSTADRRPPTVRSTDNEIQELAEKNEPGSMLEGDEIPLDPRQPLEKTGLAWSTSLSCDRTNCQLDVNVPICPGQTQLLRH